MIFEALKANREQPLDILFGSDWWSDCDDVAALDILLKAHKSGVIRLNAIGINSVMAYSAPSVKALCEQYDLSDIPIGLESAAQRKGLLCLYQRKLAGFCQSAFSNAHCPEAYKLYRKTLAAVPGKAVIVDVGFPGLLMELLQSLPDEYSRLSGIDLVNQKVSEMILMGGRWDKAQGKEYNFCTYPLNKKAADYICRKCPVPLTFLGYEVGKSIITGGKAAPGLTGSAYAAHISPWGRPSWDPMTVLYAVIGDAEKAGYRKVCGRASVNPESGKNSFQTDPCGQHAYLVKTKEADFYKKQIDEILMME